MLGPAGMQGRTGRSTRIAVLGAAVLALVCGAADARAAPPPEDRPGPAGATRASSVPCTAPAST